MFDIASLVWKALLVLSASGFLWTISEITLARQKLTKLDCKIHINESAPLKNSNSNLTGDSYSTMRLQVMMEIESSLLFHTHSKPLAVAKDISFGRYYAQRDIQGWTIAYTNMSFEFIETSFRTPVKLSDFSVFLCLGIHAQDKHCLKPFAFRQLQRVQKYNQIHGIREILWRKDGFCYTIREALRGYKGNKTFTFPCWVLPKDRQALEQEMNKEKAPWIVKPSGQGEGHGIFVVNYFNEILSKHQVYDNFVVQPLLTNPYLIEGKKFDFRIYILVTSVLPLRAYIYKEGLVRFASSKYNSTATKGGNERQYLTNTSVGKKYTHLANLTWTFKKLKKHFSTIGVDSEEVFDRINNAIVLTLLSAEYRFQRNFALNLGGYDCHSCFQLLGVDVILDSNLHPYVIEVNGLPSMQLSHSLGVPPDPKNEYTITKFGLMHDMLQILFKPTSVVTDLSKQLGMLKVGIKPGPLCDESKHIVCVDFKELQKLIDSKREFVNKGGYERIYPSPKGGRYSKFIRWMDNLIRKRFGEAGLPIPRNLWHMHHLYTALEKLYYTQA